MKLNLVAAALGLPVRLTGVPGKLGREDSMRNPRRTAATASAGMRYSRMSVATLRPRRSQ